MALVEAVHRFALRISGGTPLPSMLKSQGLYFVSLHRGDGLTGLTSDGEAYAFISVVISFAIGTPPTWAINPCATPEASL